MPSHTGMAIRRLTPDLMRARLDEAMDVYITAMQYDSVWRTTRRDPWERAIDKPEWEAYGAFITPAETHLAGEEAALTGSEPLVGITFGYRGEPHSWWTSTVRYGMEMAGYPADAIATILGNYFELSELHVLPSYQGRGLGHQLLCALLHNHRSQHVLLSTPEVPDEDSPAWHLYRSIGFQDLLRHFMFPGDERPFGVLFRPILCRRE